MGLPVEVNNLMMGSLGGYNINRSLRFRSSASAYLNRTFGTPTNEKIWTWSGWVKRGTFGILNSLFNASTGASPAYDGFRFNTSDQLQFFTGGAVTVNLVTNAVYRDPSAWYHVLLSYNATTTTVTIYVNGVAQTTTGTTVSNTTYSFNHASTLHSIGAQVVNGVYAAGTYFDGYLAEVNFIDGQALTPSSFGAYDTNGVWQPKKYTGTYGTNGFYLPFSDTTSTTTLVADSSGNGNNFTPNNISLTAGTTYDSMIDSPTVSASASNYAVWNPIQNVNGGTSIAATITDGNLKATASSSAPNIVASSISVTSGKWYCELTFLANSAVNTYPYFGFGPLYSVAAGNIIGGNTFGVSYNQAGQKFYNSAATSYGSAWAVNNVIGMAVDLDSAQRTVTFYVNNVSQGAINIATTTDASVVSLATYGSGESGAINFGQRPFSYTPPTGFNALNTYNLPAPSIANGAQYMAATTYTGNGTSVSVLNSNNNTIGTTFQPDFVWLKSRSSADQHNLIDVVRGTGNRLRTDATSAEEATPGTFTLNSNGFTAATSNVSFNGNGSSYIGWQWKAGGTGVTNTSGTITSTVSANPTAGFSIVTYTGNGSSSATVGHGLGVTPNMIIVKGRSIVKGWSVYHSSLSAGTYLALNGTSAASNISGTTEGAISTSPTSSTFGFTSGSSNANNVNTNGATYVAYCFAAVSGYSAMGSFVGNGSNDGPFVYCGFRPRFIILKNASVGGAGYDWEIVDTSRSTYNVVSAELAANLSNAESSSWNAVDILSNGFKLRDLGAAQNGNGNTIIYMAFAESPFRISRAR